MSNENLGGLTAFVNGATKMAGNKTEEIVNIPIEKLIPYEKNFYGLRDIDSLAGLISVSRYIEPLTVVPREDGNYTILSGHRRRAAIAALIDTEDFPSEVPCIIKHPEGFSLELENGEQANFSADDAAMLVMIAANKGQREERTLEEKRQEIAILDPFAQAIYAEKKRKGYKGSYKNFFAEEIIQMSTSQVQRLRSVTKLTDKVKDAVDKGLISESAAFEIATLPPEEQNSIVEAVISGGLDNSIKAIREERKKREGKFDDIEEEEDETDEEYEDDEEEEEEEAEEEAEEEETEVKETAQSNPTWTPSNNNTTEQYPQNRREETIIPAEKTFKESIKSELPPAPKETPEDPNKEAEEWFKQARIIAIKTICEEAERMKNEFEGVDPVQSAQWGVRAAVAMYQLASLQNE